MKVIPHLLDGFAARKAGKANKKIAYANAQQIEAEGAADATDMLTEGRQTEGAQLVSLAGSGFDVGSGTAFDLLRQTEQETTLNMIKRRRMAALEANATRAQGDAAKKAGRTQFMSSMFSAAGEAIDYAASAAGGA